MSGYTNKDSELRFEERQQVKHEVTGSNPAVNQFVFAQLQFQEHI